MGERICGVFMIDIELIKLSKLIMEKSFCIKPGEEFLVIIDPVSPTSFVWEMEFAEALLASAYTAGAVPQMIVLPRWPYPPTMEPPKATAAAMKSVDAFVLMAPLWKTKALAEAGKVKKTGIRILTIAFARRDLLIRLWSADWEKMSEQGKMLSDVLAKGKRCRITSKEGSDLTVSVAGRPSKLITCMVDRVNNYGADPAEFAIIPASGDAEGTLVFDGSNQIVGLLSEPVKMTVNRGMITGINGGKQAQEFKAFIESFNDPNAYNCPAHICIGLNPNGKLTDLPLPERTLGVVTIGIGHSMDIGGEVYSTFHNDFSINKATITVDETQVLKDGKLVLAHE